MNSVTCREKATELVNEMRLITEKLKTEKRNIDDGEKVQLETLDRQHEELLRQAETLEQIERVDGLSVTESRRHMRDELMAEPRDTVGKRSAVEERNKAYAGWFFHGTKRSKPEYWRAAERAGIDVTCPTMRFDFQPWTRWEERQQIIGTPTAGGDIALPFDVSLMKKIDIALKKYGDIFKTSTVVDTETGAPLPWPTTNDVNVLGELTAENTTITQKDMSFGKNTLSAYKYDSGFILVSWELMSDSVIDLTELIAKQSGIRIGRKVNADFLVTGTGGSTGPTPVLSVATLGATTAAAGGTTIAYADLNAIYHAVDPAYREEPGCAWLYSDSFSMAVEALTDTTGRPLVHAALEGISQTTAQPTLLGKPVYINQALPAVASAAKVALFGDLEKIILRRVSGGADGGFVVQRFNELFAQKGLVGFLTWMRADCLLSDAGTHPVQFLQMHV
jgi:HK97 family phage major capsid protein